MVYLYPPGYGQPSELEARRDEIIGPPPVPYEMQCGDWSRHRPSWHAHEHLCTCVRCRRERGLRAAGYVPRAQLSSGVDGLDAAVPRRSRLVDVSVEPPPPGSVAQSHLAAAPQAASGARGAGLAATAWPAPEPPAASVEPLLDVHDPLVAELRRSLDDAIVSVADHLHRSGALARRHLRTLARPDDDSDGSEGEGARTAARAWADGDAQEDSTP